MVLRTTSGKEDPGPSTAVVKTRPGFGMGEAVTQKSYFYLFCNILQGILYIMCLRFYSIALQITLFAWFYCSPWKLPRAKPASFVQHSATEPSRDLHSRFSDAELSRNLSIVVYGDMRFTDPSNTRKWRIPGRGVSWRKK